MGMHSVLKYASTIVASLIAASPAFAADTGFSPGLPVEPHNLLIGLATVGLIGLAAGNGIGSRQKSPAVRRYASHLTVPHPLPANEAVALAEAA